jgi:hypothetical protein
LTGVEADGVVSCGIKEAVDSAMVVKGQLEWHTGRQREGSFAKLREPFEFTWQHVSFSRLRVERKGRTAKGEVVNGRIGRVSGESGLEAEGAGVAGGESEAVERAGFEFTGHEVRTGREGVVQVGGEFGGEAVARVVVGVAEDDNCFDSLVGEHGLAHVDESAADPAALVFGVDAQRGQGSGVDHLFGREERKSREEDVSDEGVVIFGDKFEQDDIFGAERADKLGFFLAAKGLADDFMNRRVILGVGRTQGDHFCGGR